MRQDMLALAGGFERLAETLASAVAAGGGRVHTDARLVGIGPGPEPAMQVLRFGGAAPATVTARRTILAMGRHAIEAIADFPARDAPGSPLPRLLRQVVPCAMGKLLLLYPTAWWSGLGLGSSFSATDMPLGQVWLLGGEAGAGSPHGVAVAQFDGPAVDFWRSLAGAADAMPVQRDGGSPLAREAHRQIGAIFRPLLRRPPPGPAAACFMDWTAAPFGGAIHLWGPEADAGADAEAMLRPLDGLWLHVCGEAWSHCQGWVEGALERSDALLQRCFGLPPPVPPSG
jgi:hypothetical protein